VPRGSAELVELFGEIDVYLFDQLLRGRITPGLRVLDAGCGGGRNLIYLMRAGCHVYGVDRDGERVAEVRALAGRLAPDLPSENFRAESVESMTFAAVSSTPSSRTPYFTLPMMKTTLPRWWRSCGACWLPEGFSSRGWRRR
jgi:SAM-dependent methyltransferase